MATEEGEDGQCAEKVGLKRKLTGPPRLLLGKTKTENRCEARAKRNKAETTSDETGTDSSPKHSDAVVEEQEAAGATSFSLTETPKMDEEVSSEIPAVPCRGRCGPEGEDTSEEDDARNRRANKRSWWRIFSPAVICVRRQKTEVEKSSSGGASAELQAERSAPPEGAESTLMSNVQVAPNDEKVTKGKRRFTVRTWPMFKRFLTSSADAQRRGERRRRGAEEGDRKPSLPLRRKLQRFLRRGGREPPQSLAQENMEVRGDESAPQGSSVAQTDELPEDLTDGPGRRSEVVTVTAEMSGQLPEERERAASETTRQDESPNLETTEEQQILEIFIEEDLTDTANGSETIQSDSVAETEGGIACAAGKDVPVDLTADTNEVPTDDVNEVASSEVIESDTEIHNTIESDTEIHNAIESDTEIHNAIESDTEIHNAVSVATDANDQLSIQILSSEEAPDAPTAGTTSQTDQMDGLTIFPNSFSEISRNPRVQVDPPEPDGVGQEEDGWEASSSTENHLFLHVGPAETQLVQTARSLVQAAMNAAMQQLSRERQSVASSVHRELQGCRDHA